MHSIRVLVADDHALVRAGICALLRGLFGIQVVGEAADGQAALALIHTQQPHVALLDIGMAKLNGLLAAARVRLECPQTRVLILSMHANPAYVSQALAGGASGYLLKDAATAELEEAVRATARGERYLSRTLPKAAIEARPQRAATTHAEPSNPGAPLTPRQGAVLQLIAEGHTTKEIAVLFGVSFKTAETHRTHLMQRLDLHDVAGLVRYAIDRGVVTTSPGADFAEIR